MMRFKRFPKMLRREITPLRLAMAKRTIQRKLDDVPLFPEMVAVQDPATYCEKADAGAMHWWQDQRDIRARQWREARRAVRSLRPTLARGIMRLWQRGHLPGDSSYFAGLIGDCVRHRRSPWHQLRLFRMFEVYGPRIAVDPEIRRRIKAIEEMR